MRTEDARGDARMLTSGYERALIIHLFEFPHALEIAIRGYALHYLATYLYELANRANRFYETEPVLQEKDARRRAARLLLVRTVLRALKKGLWLLGVEALERV